MGGEFSNEEAYPRVVCWIDDNHQPNNLTIIDALKEKNIRVELFSTTSEFINFYQNSQLDDAPFSALRIITDMARTEHGKLNKTAGYDVLTFLRSNKYQHPILIYQSEKNVPRTVTYLREHKISWVFAESSLAQAKEFALFSAHYTASFPIDQSEARPLERNPENNNKTEKSVNRADYDRIKVEFQDEVQEISRNMIKDSFSCYKIPILDSDTVQQLPVKNRPWHILLIGELTKNAFFKIGNYFLAQTNLESRELPPELHALPLYAAIAVRLYSGQHLYRHYLEDIKNGQFDNWKFFTAALETAFYFIPVWKGVVFRGTNSRNISPFYHEQMKCSDFVFLIIGVTSSSYKKPVAVKFIEPMKSNPTLYKLYCNNGRNISALSEYQSEAEILLPIFSAWVIVETGWIDVEKNQNTIKTRFVQAVQIDTPNLEDIETDLEETIEYGKKLLKESGDN